MMSFNREFRRYALLNLIQAFGPISRTQLADVSGFRPATVGEIAKALLDEGLAVETGFASAATGRRRTMLELNRTGIGAVGIAITRTHATTVLARLDGTILREETWQRGADASRETLSARIADRVAALLENVDGLRLVGIGIAEPPYDPADYRKDDSLTVNYGHFNDWIHLSLRPMLEARFDLPVRTFSAVTLPALVERQYGAARGSDNFICVELSNGVGASIFAGGVALSGAHGTAGELGHTVVDIGSGAACYCGKTGCVELGASFPELARALATAIARGAHTKLSPEDITPEAVRKALDDGDPLCRAYVDRAATLAGTAIANAVNLLNPDRVVLYGYMLALGDYYLDRLREAIRHQTLEISGGYEIVTSPALESKIPLGAAVEMFTHFLRSDEYRWVYDMMGESEK